MARGRERRGPRLRLGAARQRRDPAPLPGGDRPLLGARRRRTRSSRSTTSARAACRTRCPSWCTAAARRALRAARGAQRRARHVAAARSGATRRRSATCSRSRPTALDALRARSARASAARSRCVGTRDRRRPPAWSTIRTSATAPVDMPLDVLLGKPPRMHARRRSAGAPRCAPLDLARRSSWRRPCYRVLRLPTVADKTFLITIGDRTVGGLCARDQMVGPWQVPVADCAVTLTDFDGYAGEAMAMGERTPLALIDAPASGRMAVGEALTNIAAAPIARPRRTSSSRPTGWRPPAIPARTPRSSTRCARWRMELCPALGIAIPVGKDSLSMRTTWHDGRRDEGGHRAAVADRLGLRAGATTRAARSRRSCARTAGATELVLDRPRRAARTGSAARRSRRCYGAARRRGARPRRSRRAARRSSRAIQALDARRHCCSPTTTAPTAACSRRCARWPSPARCGVDARPRLPRRRPARARLFDGEELRRGACRCATASACSRRCSREELGARPGPGRPSGARSARRAPRGPHASASDDRAQSGGAQARARRETRVDLQRAWSETTLPRCSGCATTRRARDEEYDRILDAGDPGLQRRS